MKGTNVDGVYDCHSQDSNVTFEHITFQDLASRGLTSMDTMALNFCEENSIPGRNLFLSFIIVSHFQLLSSRQIRL